MEQNPNQRPRPVSSRRKKRSQIQIFREDYLPLVIIGIALILILVFIIGSISLGVQKRKFDRHNALEASASIAAEEARLNEQAQKLVSEADSLASGFDYDGAISVLNKFTGDPSAYPLISDKLTEYTAAKEQLVAWNDPSQIPNLSFQLLIADTSRAFTHEIYGSSFNRNFVTTGEFTAILQQLYDNGYILVSLDDFLTTQTADDGSTVFTAKPLYLPNGKKPIVLTQTNVNYNLYLIDSDGDMLPDDKGGGFASKLVLNEDGSFACEMIDSNGQTVTGNYDLVPILESFIASHPDFSYKGARAVLALTGYNGLFGYRTHKAAIEALGETAYTEAVNRATTVAAALRSAGYELAFYTYENIPYGESSTTQILSDLKNWQEEAESIVGKLDIMVYAQQSDISTDEVYSGEKYETLKNAGFNYFLGFCENGVSKVSIANDYVRQGRILVSGSSMAYHSEWFSNLFDASMVLDKTRGTIPQ